MNVELADLRAIADLLFKYLDHTGRHAFDLADDYYWEISPTELYDPTKSPTDLTLGQLSHDWERLRAILAADDPPIGHALVWVSSVLRNVGEKSAY